MIGIIDYGMGNLHSVKNAFDHLQIENIISDDPEVLKECSHLVLPGVGAFGDMIENLKNQNLIDFLKDQVQNQNKKLLGICLGMQALYETSQEKGNHEGLGFLKGSVIAMEDPYGEIRIPQIGWNNLIFSDHPVRNKLDEDSWFYFDHSYFADNTDPCEIIAITRYGPYDIPAIVGNDKVLGVQGHPEKSGENGLRLLKWFAEEM